MLPYRLQLRESLYSEPNRLLHLIVTISQGNASLSHPFFRGVKYGSLVARTIELETEKQQFCGLTSRV